MEAALPQLSVSPTGSSLGLGSRWRRPTCSRPPRWCSLGSHGLGFIGGVVHLSVVIGDQGSEEDVEKLLLTEKLLGAVLAEAQVVGVGRPLLIVGNFALPKGIGAGWFVDLA